MAWPGYSTLPLQLGEATGDPLAYLVIASLIGLGEWREVGLWPIFTSVSMNYVRRQA